MPPEDKEVVNSAPKEETSATDDQAKEETSPATARPRGETTPAGRRETNSPAEEEGEEPTGRPVLARIVFPVIIGLLVVAVIALFANSRAQSSRLEAEAQARKLAEEQAGDLEEDLSDRLRELNEVSDQLRIAEAGRSQLEEEVVKLRAGKIQLDYQLQTLQNQNARLDERLQAEQAALSELRESFRESREAQKRYLEQIEKLLEDKNELQNRLAAARTVEMPGLLVQDSQADIPSFRGTILKVNPEYNFAVINRGSSDGVVVGTTFRVLDGEREIGEVTATRVLPDMTVADINAARTHRRLKTGFTVLVNE